MVRTGQCIVVELEEPDRSFSAVTSALGEADVNIDGFSAQAGEDGARAFVITEDSDRGRQALEDAGVPVELQPYVAATLTSRPGELARTITRLHESGIHPSATFLVMAPWGPDLQVAFAVEDAPSTEKVLAEFEENRGTP